MKISEQRLGIVGGKCWGRERRLEAPPTGTKGNQLEGASVGWVNEQKQDGGRGSSVCPGSTVESATLTHLAAEVHFLASATFDDRV